MGRRKLFFITLFLYVAATAATAFSWNLASFVLFRFLTSAGIGGEYTAINSTIQEFTPARLRGWTDLAINGTFGVGAGIGAAGSLVLLDPGMLPPDLGLARVFFDRRGALPVDSLHGDVVPGSPRWLITHNQVDDACKVVKRSRRTSANTASRSRIRPSSRCGSRRESTPLGEVFHSLFHTHRRRSLVGLMLMIAQAFFYNAIFFTYAPVLTDFYKVPDDHIGWYVLPFAVGNFLGPVLLGKLFDVLGRRRMIAFTYAISGVLLTISGWMFMYGMLTVTTQTIAWIVIFFASSAASSVYLTVSETFPLEIRARSPSPCSMRSGPLWAASSGRRCSAS